MFSYGGVFASYVSILIFILIAARSAELTYLGGGWGCIFLGLSPPPSSHEALERVSDRAALPRGLLMEMLFFCIFAFFLFIQQLQVGRLIPLTTHLLSL